MPDWLEYPHSLLVLAAGVYAAGVTDIGVVSPFVAQARLLHKMLLDHPMEGVVASTVHRFQGSERSVMIVDLADGYPQRRPAVLLSGPMGSSAMRLINVAITRAQHKLIILADMRFFMDKLSRNSTVRQILGLAAAAGDNVFRAHELLKALRSSEGPLGDQDVAAAGDTTGPEAPGRSAGVGGVEQWGRSYRA